MRRPGEFSIEPSDAEWARRWQDSIRNTVLGRCKTDGVETSCASDLKACPVGAGADADEWVGPDPECRVENTSFGRCDYGMCAWSHDHCNEDNTWDAFDEGCTCDHVQVGACSRWKDEERQVFCAVSELACDEEQSWITPQEVKTAAGFDCFLCREVPVAATSDLIMAKEDTDMTKIGSATTNSRTIIVISATFGFIIASSIIGLVAWRVFKTRRAVKRATDGAFENDQETPPTITVEMNIDENNDDETDKASVLSDE